MRKKLYVILAGLLVWSVAGVPSVFAGDVGGLWTKTTSPDPNNIAIFYQERNELKAMGYSEVRGTKVVWQAAGKITGNRLHFSYHHSSEAVPPGWERHGVMELTLSDNGNRLFGTARSTSGAWSGNIEFKRVRLELAFAD